MLLRKHYNTEGIPTDQMIQHLQQHGFEITRLTDELMKYDDGVMTTPITTRHVVMMNIRATANKNTWVLMWGNSIIHNYQKIKISTLTFANHNILEKFLVWNSRWINDHDLLAALMQSDFEKFEHTYENTTGLDRDRMLRDQAYAQLLFGTNDVSAFHLAETRDGIDRPDDDLMG